MRKLRESITLIALHRVVAETQHPFTLPIASFLVQFCRTKMGIFWPEFDWLRDNGRLLNKAYNDKAVFPVFAIGVAYNAEDKTIATVRRIAIDQIVVLVKANYPSLYNPMRQVFGHVFQEKVRTATIIDSTLHTLAVNWFEPFPRVSNARRTMSTARAGSGSRYTFRLLNGGRTVSAVTGVSRREPTSVLERILERENALNNRRSDRDETQLTAFIQRWRVRNAILDIMEASARNPNEN